MAYADLPRIRLLEHPTPLQRMARIGAELGHPFLFVKRDDVMALGLGGNKVRSLEFWIGEALDQDCDTLVVAGAPASNQCRLTAAAAAKLGLRCMIVHNDNPPEHLEGNLLLSHLFGAEISYIGPVDEDIRHEVVKEKVEERRKAGAKPYIIGDEVLGAAGYVVAALELLDQAAQIDVAFDHFVIPGSMGPTEAGFLYGLLSGGFRGQVHVISVEYGVEEMAARIEAIFARLEARIGVLNVAPSTIARYDDTFLGDGYGKMSPAAADAIKRFGTTEALLLETTYTAKPFAALLAMIERGSIGAHEPVCALHTGGLPSLFDTSTLRRFSDAKIFTNSP